MPTDPLSYAYGPFVSCLRALCFMPAGPLFYACGPFVLLPLLYAVLTVSLMICYPCYPAIQLVIWSLSQIPSIGQLPHHFTWSYLSHFLGNMEWNLFWNLRRCYNCRRKTTLGHQMSNCIAIKRDSISWGSSIQSINQQIGQGPLGIKARRPVGIKGKGPAGIRQ